MDELWLWNSYRADATSWQAICPLGPPVRLIGGSPRSAPEQSPQRPRHQLSSIHQRLLIFTAAAASALVFWFVLRRTRVGLEMRAVVDRRGLATLRGISEARTSAIAWVLTMVLAGLGGVLIAPIFQLSDRWAAELAPIIRDFLLQETEVAV